MRAVLAISDVNHIVFGSDWPYTEALFLGAGDPAPQLSDTFSTEQRHAIERGNILTQLPSVAARLGAAPTRRPAASLGAVRIRRGPSGARTVKFTVTTGGPAQISARIARGAHTIASGGYPPSAPDVTRSSSRSSRRESAVATARHRPGRVRHPDRAYAFSGGSVSTLSD